jgi:hypothetical protein
MSFDLRYLSGPASVLTGAMLLFLAYRLWHVHPINRVFRLGPFVTERGMVAVLNMRSTFAACGLWLIAGGLTKSAYWFWRQDTGHSLIQALGTLETGLALLVSALVTIAAVQIARLK